MPGLSRSQIQKLIQDGRAHVGSAVVSRGSEPVGGGERVTLDVPPPAAPPVEPEALPLAILHEDADLIVIDKPAGMVVHPAAGHAEGTLVNALLHHVRT